MGGVSLSKMRKQLRNSFVYVLNGWVVECCAERGDLGLQMDLLDTVNLTLLRNISKISKSNSRRNCVHPVVCLAWEL